MIEDYEGPVRIGPVPFGERNEDLGKLVCETIQNCMPPTQIAWRRGQYRLKRIMRSMHLHSEIGEDPNAVRQMQSLRSQAYARKEPIDLYAHPAVQALRQDQVPDR